MIGPGKTSANDPTGADRIARLLRRFRELTAERQVYEGLWRDCYAYALPHRQPIGVSGSARPAPDSLYDATALDAVDQLAASLLAQLTPPWTRWFGLSAGDDLPADERDVIERELEVVSRTLQAHFDRSNFTVEIHQCFLDLVVGGTASLLFEEAPPGSDSAFRFRAIPLAQVYLDEASDGRLTVTFRRHRLPLSEFRDRFPKAEVEPQQGDPTNEAEPEVEVVEAIEPAGALFRYTAFRPSGPDGKPVHLRTGEFRNAPFINFRWMKAPGDPWGRSPVMKALPDIKTAKLENLGWLNRTDGDDAWREETIAGQVHRSPAVLLDRCIRAPHPLRGGDDFWWPVYPEPQLAALYELMSAIVEEHASITHLVGHDEVSPAKFDPGPLLDMDVLRAIFDLKGVPAPAAAGREAA